MIITMITMRVMQAAIDQIIGMIAMGHCLMATTRAMRMRATRLHGRTTIWIRRVHLENMLVIVPFVGVVQVTVVKVVGVIAMLNGGVATIRAMRMLGVIVGLVLSHGTPQLRGFVLVNQSTQLFYTEFRAGAKCVAGCSPQRLSN